MTYQSFFTGMMGARDEALRKADVRKLAEKHSVPLDWAEMTLKAWLGRA